MGLGVLGPPSAHLAIFGNLWSPKAFSFQSTVEAA
jgi:hypothetical protein